MTTALEILMDELSDTRDRIDMMLEVTAAAGAFCAVAAKNGAGVDLHVNGGGIDAWISLLVDLSAVGRDQAEAEAVVPLPTADDLAEDLAEGEDNDSGAWEVVEDVRFWSCRAAEPEEEPEPDRSQNGAEPQPETAAQAGPEPEATDRTPDWGPGEDALLLKERGRGATFAAIGASLGRTPGACRMRFNKISARAADPSAAEAATAPEPAPSVAVAADPALATAETAAPAAAPDTAPPHAALAGADARVSWRLDQLGYRRGWSADRDLDLAEGLGQGRKIAEIAMDIGLDAAECKRRWFDLCPSGGLDEQQQILRVLRHRAAAAQTKAA